MISGRNMLRYGRKCARMMSTEPMWVASPFPKSAIPLDVSDRVALDAQLESVFGALPKKMQAHQWHEYFYMYPRVDLILPAFSSALSETGALVGGAQLSTALIYGRVLGRLKAIVESALKAEEGTDEKEAGENAAAMAYRAMLEIVQNQYETEKEVGVGGDETNVEEAALEAFSQRALGMGFVALHSGSSVLLEAGRHVHSSLAEAAGTGVSASMAASLRDDAFNEVDPVRWPWAGLREEEGDFVSSVKAFYGEDGQHHPPVWTKSAFHLAMSYELANRDGGIGKDVGAMCEAVGGDILRSLWGHFFTTGDMGAIRKILRAAAGWMRFADTYDVEHLLEPSKLPVPAEFVSAPSTWQWMMSDGGSGNEGSEEESMERARFVLSRAAAHSLVDACSRHPTVLEVIEAERAQAIPPDERLPTSDALERDTEAMIDLLRPCLHDALAAARTEALDIANGGAIRSDDGSNTFPLPPVIVAVGVPLPQRVTKAWIDEDLGGGKDLVNHPTSALIQKAFKDAIQEDQKPQ